MKLIKKRVLIAALSVVLSGVMTVTSSVAADSRGIPEQEVAEEDKTSSFKVSGRIWIAGDSIAADHSYENEADYARFVHGWGEVIGNYLTEDARIYNKAISGQTAKFFTEEENYQDIMDGIQAGDLLLIQFGHNDYKSDGTDHWELPTDTEGSYRWYLKNYYIEPALAAGAMPVLCTSVVQCRSDAESGLIGDNQAQHKFAVSMRILYEEYRSQGVEIGFIDTYALTQTYLNSSSVNQDAHYALKYDRGNKESTSLDRVHFSEAGANMAANMIAQNLQLMYSGFNNYTKKGLTDAGSGTMEDPYCISSWSQLYRIMQDDEYNVPDKYYRLTDNLYPMLQQQEWKTVFRANLDGDGHTVYNPVGTSLMAVFDENYGTICNVTIHCLLEHTTSNQQAVFVRENYGTIRNCTAEGSATFYCYDATDETVWQLGAFASVNHENAVIEQCKNRMEIETGGNVPQVYLGGIAGYNRGIIRECSNYKKLVIDTSEYDSAATHPTYSRVIYCNGGIAGITKSRDAVMDSLGTKMPVNKSSLEGKVVKLLSDEVVPVTEEELEKLIREESSETNPSETPGASEIPEPIVTPAPGTSQAPADSDAPEGAMKGDLDGNHKVELADAQLALKAALKMIQPDAQELLAGDLDKNGKIELQEAQQILKAALKMIML